jgi:hypothetical protein
MIDTYNAEMGTTLSRTPSKTLKALNIKAASYLYNSKLDCVVLPPTRAFTVSPRVRPNHPQRVEAMFVCIATPWNP